MQNGTDRKKKRGAILCAAIVMGVLGILLGIVIFPLIGTVWGEMAAVGILVVYGGVIAAVIAGVAAALRQRLREINGGEEEAASRY